MGRALLTVYFVFLMSSAIAETPQAHSERLPRPRSEARPVECPKEVKDVVVQLEAMTKNGSPWRSIPATDLRFALTVGEVTKQYFLIGYNREELLKSNLQFDRCAGTNTAVQIRHPDAELLRDSKLQVLDANRPEMNMFMPKDWNSLGIELSRLKLCDDTELPLICINLDSLKRIPKVHDRKIFSSPDYLPVVMTHELFHLYQFKKFSRFFVWASDKNPQVLAQCRANKEWMIDMEMELKDWTKINDLKKHAGRNDAEIHTLLLSLLSRRTRFGISIDTQKCWQWMEYGESVEGTPTFFSSELARRAGIALGADPLSVLENRHLTVHNPEFFEEDRGVYYLTGAFLLQAIEKYGGDRPWHEDIEKGKTVADTLRHLLEPGSSGE
jgi:hypothetical protein